MRSVTNTPTAEAMSKLSDLLSKTHFPFAFPLEINGVQLATVENRMGWWVDISLSPELRQLVADTITWASPDRITPLSDIEDIEWLAAKVYGSKRMSYKQAERLMPYPHAVGACSICGTDMILSDRRRRFCSPTCSEQGKRRPAPSGSSTKS